MIYFQVICAAVAVYFTAIVFSAPKRLSAYIGLLGGLGWLAYLIFLGIYDHMIATYLSSFVIAIFSHMGARVFKTPVTVFFIPSFFPLVPGARMYQGIYSYIMGQTSRGHEYIFETILTAGMIALAIFTVDSIFRIGSQTLKK